MPRRLSFRRRQPKPAASDRPARLLRLRRTGVGQAATRLAALILRRDKAPRPDRARASDPLRLTARLFAIGFIACMLQLLVVAQIGVFGVTAELAPLVVAAAGFLCGSLAGACFGFGVGLFIDLAFVQVLGISSLLFTVIGYGAGRLRELRAPDAPTTRLGLGAAATALSLGGYGAIEFMLGVNTPVSYGLVGALIKTTLFNSLIALPVYALTRRSLLGALPASERDPNRAATTKRMSPLTRA
jgi:rod shape-determining protein MreD